MQFDVEFMIPKLFMSHTEHKHWMPHTQSAKNKWFVTLNWAVSIASMDKIRFEGKIRGHFVKSFGLNRFRFAWYVDAHKQTAAKVECDNQNGNRLVLSVMSLTVCLTFFLCVCVYWCWRLLFVFVHVIVVLNCSQKCGSHNWHNEIQRRRCCRINAWAFVHLCIVLLQLTGQLARWPNKCASIYCVSRVISGGY